MFRRLRTKVKEQGFRTTVKEAGTKLLGGTQLVNLLGVVALIAIFGALALLAVRPCPTAVDPAAAATIQVLQHQISLLETKVTSVNENLEPAEENFEDGEEVLTDDEGAPDLEALHMQVAAAKSDMQILSSIKRSGPRPDGRVELEPINTGCYSITDSAECCNKIDSRYTIHGPLFYGGVPCMPSAPGTQFSTGNKCEPEVFAQTESMRVQGSCSPSDQNAETLEDVIQRQTAEARSRRTPAEAHDLNLMWVTDCQTPLEWSSVLLLWSAFNVKQPGDFTRIATGCESPKEREFVIDAMNTVADIFGARDRVTVHFAPKHITDERDLTDGEVYTPYTKAFGVKHFLDRDKPHSRVGVILDPDFVFNRPLEYKINHLDEKYVILPSYTRDAGDWRHDVEPGRPVAQLYGLGTGWLDYDRETICGHGSPCTRVTEADAWK